MADIVLDKIIDDLDIATNSIGDVQYTRAEVRQLMRPAITLALQEAAEDAETEEVGFCNGGGESDSYYVVNKQSILNVVNKVV